MVLSAAHDRIFKLNGVGALTWTIIEQSQTGVQLDQLFETLSSRFDNSELKEDTTRFVDDLVRNGLLEVVRERNLQTKYRIADGTSATTSTTLGIDNTTMGPSASQSPVTEIHPAKWETITAFFGLLLSDFVLRMRGFDSLIRTVESWPTREPQNTNFDICRHVYAMVNRAQVYYPRKAMCLQHSALVTCLLRRRGVPAQMILAAQEFPPKAHAWVEVAGTVVNDSQQVKTRYREMRRI